MLDGIHSMENQHARYVFLEPGHSVDPLSAYHAIKVLSTPLLELVPLLNAHLAVLVLTLRLKEPWCRVKIVLDVPEAHIALSSVVLIPLFYLVLMEVLLMGRMLPPSQIAMSA